MKTKSFFKAFCLILCAVLIAAMALTSSGCGKNNGLPSDVTENVEKGTKLGEGEKSFNFTVTDVEGNTKAYIIKTDKKTVGEALIELGLISGEEGQYGLYVKTVDGMTFDYNKDGKYWAFYVDGQYGTSGVELTDIEEGKIYSFKVE